MKLLKKDLQELQTMRSLFILKLQPTRNTTEGCFMGYVNATGKEIIVRDLEEGFQNWLLEVKAV